MSSAHTSGRPNAADRCETLTFGSFEMSNAPVHEVHALAAGEEALAAARRCVRMLASSRSRICGSRVRSHSVSQAPASEPQSVPKPRYAKSPVRVVDLRDSRSGSLRVG